MTLGSLFDGAGGFPFAAQICGIEPVWASEIEPFPVKVTTKRFPKMKHLGDITKINGAEIEPVDIITFGSPCQDLSVAGRQAGLAGERSGLFMEAVRIIKEMRGKTNGRKPTLAIWENVPGAFSSNKGEDFRVVIEELCKVKDGGAVIPRPPKGKWADAGEIVGDGCSVAWRVLDAQFWGVPQRRRRIFLVADFGGECAGEILFKRESLSRNFAESRESWQGITKSLAFGSGEASRIISAGFSGNQGEKAGGGGFHEEQSPTLKAAQSGTNAVPDVVCYDARGNGDGDIAPTITGDHENRVTDYTAVVIGSRSGVERPFVMCMATQQGGAEIGKDMCPTITAAAGMSGNNQPVVCFWDGGQTASTLTSRNAGGGQRMPDKDNFNAVLCVALDRSAYNQGQNAKFDMGIDEEGTAYTVVAKGPGAVCYAIGNGQANQTRLSDIPGALNGFDPVACRDLAQYFLRDCANTLFNGTSPGFHNGVVIYLGDIIVRRLTPTECARLQGMPDWWCDDVSHSDTAEYKMWGNGMALPCVLYVMEGVEKLLKERENDAT